VSTENPDRSSSPHFTEIVEVRMSRRRALIGGAATAAAFVAGTTLLQAAPAAAASSTGGVDLGRGRPGPTSPRLRFDAIPLGTGDTPAVPAGYRAVPFLPWGTPILGAFPAFVPGGNTAAEQEQQVGMHHDGMHYFPLQGDRRGLLCVNHEYTDEALLQTGVAQSGTWLTTEKPNWTLEMVRTSQAAHGVSVVEIERDRHGEWTVARSRRNRRITANTAMSFAGPARGHRLVQTTADPAGTTPLGTINNCAHGVTPWGTYLTCEENFNGYFRVEAGAYSAEQSAMTSRYGVGGDRNNWATTDPRFVVTVAEPNEANRFGWVVEIDPMNPRSTPAKRTALGRVKHEGATVHVARSGQAVVYMGDDQVNEFIYKFVSRTSWRRMVARGTSPLDDGTLYVARFDDDGTGEWLPLVQGAGPLTAASGFADQGDVLVKTRLAATLVGATPMDRPEWTAVDPTTGTVYCTLTNNTSGAKVVNGPNPRKPNQWGHIVGWREAGGRHEATTFEWDLLLIAGQGREVVPADGSTIAAEDAFASPDGLWADAAGRIWIQTDGSQPSGANDQMLVADPTTLDDQGVPEVKRFFTGVTGAEVTGITATPSQDTVFVNLQHPGESGGSTWPRLDGLTIPRSSTVVITRDGGGTVGG
jgi:secreted PhoX family phosphatase